MADPISINKLYIAGRVPVAEKPTERVSAATILDYSAAFNYIIDFTSLNQQQILGRLHSMFMDNSENPSEVIVSVIETGQVFTVPAFAEGYFTLTAQYNSKISLVSVGGGSVKTSVVFYNFDQYPNVWYKYWLNPLAGIVKAEGGMDDGVTPITSQLANNPVYIGGKDYSTDTLHALSVNNVGKLLNHVNDGEDVTLGALANAFYKSGPGSVISILKGIFGKFDLGYKVCPVSATTILGGVGAIGDYLSHLIIQPQVAASGAWSVIDNATTIISAPAQVASDLRAYVIDLKAVSVSGAWKVTLGAGITATAFGRFT
jgi:hypothetical protein